MCTANKDKLLEELAEELLDYAQQYQCDCTHPACSRCQMFKSADAVLKKYFKFIEETQQ